MDLRWDPNYRMVRLMSPWSAVVENQISAKTKQCNVVDLKPKHPSKDWKLKPNSIARAARFIHHPDKLPDVDIEPDLILTVPSDPKDNVGTRYNLRKSIKENKKIMQEIYKSNKKDEKERSLVVFPLFLP